MATSTRLASLNSPMDRRWSPRTPRTAPTSRKGTPLNASVRSTVSSNSYSCERQVLHPLDPGAEPDALLHYETSDSEDDEEDEEEEVDKDPAPKTERKLFEIPTKYTELAREIQGLELSPPVSPKDTEGEGPEKPEISISDGDSKPGSDNEESKPASPSADNLGVTSLPESEAVSPRRSPDSRTSSNLARLLQLSSLDSIPDNASDKENKKPSVASPNNTRNSHNLFSTPRRYKYDQYIGQLPIGSPSPSGKNGEFRSPKSPTDIRRNLERLRRSVQIIHDRQTEQEILQDNAMREQIAAKRASVGTTLDVLDPAFSSKVDQLMAQLDERDRQERLRREQEEARLAEQRRREAEEAERLRRAQEEEQRRRQQEQEQREKEAREKAAKDAEDARLRKEQEESAARQKAEEERKSAEAAAAAAQTAVTTVPSQAITPQVQTGPESNDPARIVLSRRKEQMEHLLLKLAEVRKHVKSNPEMQKAFNKYRRALKPKIGQFNGEQKQTVLIRDFILRTFDEAKQTYPGPTVLAADYQILPPDAPRTDQVPMVYIWLINELGKMVLDQFEAESSVTASTATPIGICISSALARAPTMANGHSFLDIILARLWKHTPALRGEVWNSKHMTDADYKRVGYRRDESGKVETEDEYVNRQCGFAAGYASIASRNFTRVASLKNPHPMGNLWFLFAYFMNQDPSLLTNMHYHVIKVMLDLSHRTLIQLYAQQGMKLVSLLVGAFADGGERQGYSGGKALKAMGDFWKKEGLDVVTKK